MVKADETSLQKLLEGTKQYKVPLYQRTYSWNTKQLQRLWDDLLNLAEDRRERKVVSRTGKPASLARWLTRPAGRLLAALELAIDNAS
jgi:hypothetical protein